MRNLIVHMETGYCGSEGCDILVVVDHAEDAYITSMAHQIAIDNAASYGFEIGYVNENTEDVYTEDMIESHWEDYDPDKHDTYRAGGGSFAEDFKEYNS